MRIEVLIALLVSFHVIDVQTRKIIQWNVAMGNISPLECPFQARPDTVLNWTYPTVQDGMDQPSKQLLIRGHYLILLNASTSQQGNYSCSLGNDMTHTWNLSVCSGPLQTQCLEKTYYSQRCYPPYCKLQCPDDLNINGLIKNKNITWHKGDELLPLFSDLPFFNLKDGEVEKEREILFTCTTSYLYEGQLYKRSHIIHVTVEICQGLNQFPTITSPVKWQEFEVDVDSKLVIDCKVIQGTEFDEVYWANGDKVLDNTSLTVYYNSTSESYCGNLKMIVSLIFTKVSEEHLSNPYYSCILASADNIPPDMGNVTIKLTRRARSHILFVVQVIVPIIIVIGVASTVLYVKLRVDITLFLRDTVGCQGNSSDGKIYDAYMMCYKSDTDVGFSEKDKRWLEKVLEEKFGYNLCLYDRDVLPGQAVAESVLNCIEQSRRVVLIPTYPDPSADSGLLSAIHAALVERQTRLVLIQTKTTAALQLDPQPQSSLPEGLRLLANVRPAVIWRGNSSQTLSSSFWKHLRYHLPAPLQPRYMVVQSQGGSEGTHAYDNAMCVYLPVNNK